MSRISRVKETAKKRKKLVVGITGAEKWNNPSDKNDWGKIDGVRCDGTSDGTFDVEGHQWTDINLQYELSLFRLEDVREILSDIKDYLVDLGGIIKDCISIKRRFFNLDLVLSYIKSTFSTLGLTKSFWCIVFQSSEVYKSDMAGDMAHEELDKDRPYLPRKDLLDFNKRNPEYDAWLRKVMDREKEIYESLTHEEVMESLKSKSLSLGEGLYVLKDDKSILFADSSVFKYDMKSGYSNAKILIAMEIWAERVLGLSVEVVDEEKAQKSGMWRDLMGSITSFNAEKRDGKYGN